MTRQFGVAPKDAAKITRPLIRATAIFKLRIGDYRAMTLPPLEEAYGQLKKLSGRSFDPKAAARAEFAWWMARRTPGRNSPENVGRLIAHLYALLYGREQDEFRKAGLLRAQAADLRDRGGIACDWQKVEEVLTASYRELRKVIQESALSGGKKTSTP